MAGEAADAHITVSHLTMAYGDFLIQRDLDFSVRRGEVFIVMGGSGCGKTTLLKHMIGLMAPVSGDILYGGRSFWNATDEERELAKRQFGVLFQSGALWSSMTLAENVGLPLRLYTSIGEAEIADIVAYKLALVGLAGFEQYHPSELSGGMKKRAGLARAMALDPQILYFDEPSAGLDPLSARLLDELILELRDSLGTTVVVVSHELASIFAIGDNAVFLDADAKTQLAVGDPRQLRDSSPDPRVRRFLSRGATDDGQAAPAGVN
jgi:phospholipid/cholesterol/gamma-HCH transport system ATP-binding protein